MRYFATLKADQTSEAGTPPTPEQMAAMGAFMEEIGKAGVLVATEGLQPSARGVRVKVNNGTTVVTPGPFPVDELITAWAMVNVDSQDEAVYWTTRFLQALGGGECEVRLVYEEEDFAAPSGQ
jgi:hypothetical protein